MLNYLNFKSNKLSIDVRIHWEKYLSKSLAKIKYIALGITLSLIGCKGTKDKAEGLYVSRNNINTIDTVQIKEDGTYVNTIYRKSDKSLIYKNTGKWKFSDGCVTFEDFYAEEDEIHSEGATYENVLMTSKLPLEKMSGKTIIHHKSMYDNIYLEKIK